jgi:hypothetical protein
MGINNLILEGGPAFLQIAIITVFVKRQLTRRFPWFFAYTVFSVGATIIRHETSNQPVEYYWVYWITEVIFGILALLALSEVFELAAKIFYFGQGVSRFVPVAAVLTVLAYALWQTIYHAPAFAPGSAAVAHLQAGAYALTFGINCLETGICFLCLRLTRMKGYGIRWGQYDFGVLVGFGLMGGLNSLIYLARLVFGNSFEDLFRFAPAGVYLIVTATWFDAFRRKEPPFTKQPPTVEELNRLSEWLDQH